METKQWYAVERKDGKIQYATKAGDGGFLLWGVGFSKRLSAKSITPIEGAPPSVYMEGYASFDGLEETYFKCIQDENDWWNGWAKPYLLEEEVERFVAWANQEPYEVALDKEKNNLTIADCESGEDADVIHMEEIEGKSVYNVGWMGWCWEFSKEKPD